MFGFIILFNFKYDIYILIKKSSFFLFSLVILFSACSTDLAVIGNYKETMVVYGLLDQSQLKQYIKINKAFLGEGNAFEYAQIKDSSQFVNSLSVVLKRIKNGVEIDSYNFSPDNTIEKNPGIFYAPEQSNAIYSFQTPAGTLNVDSDYKLIVKNNQSGKEISAQTALVNDFGNLSSPNPNSPFFNCILANNNNYKYQVAWQTGKNAKIYQLVIRLNYYDSTETGNVQQKLDWIFPEQKTQGLGGGESMKNEFVGQIYMQFVGNQLNDYPGLLARIPGQLDQNKKNLMADIIVIAGGDDLNTFIEVNKPSTSIIQEKPEFTNITNGLGLLSSRYTRSAFSKPLSVTTWDSLSCGQYTKGLKFKNHLGVICQ